MSRHLERVVLEIPSSSESLQTEVLAEFTQALINKGMVNVEYSEYEGQRYTRLQGFFDIPELEDNAK